MPRSRRRGRRNTHRRRLLAAKERFGPDESEIVFTFPEDGWTVRKIERLADIRREGELMGHCLRRVVPESGPELPDIYSLRDADGYPHVTVFYHRPTRCVLDFSGHGDSFPIKTDHLLYLLGWLPDDVVLGCHPGSPFVCNSDRLRTPREHDCPCLGVHLDERMLYRAVSPPDEPGAPLFDPALALLETSAGVEENPDPLAPKRVRLPRVRRALGPSPNP